MSMDYGSCTQNNNASDCNPIGPKHPCVVSKQFTDGSCSIWSRKAYSTLQDVNVPERKHRKKSTGAIKPKYKSCWVKFETPKRKKFFFNKKGEQKLGRGKHKKKIFYKYKMIAPRAQFCCRYGTYLANFSKLCPILIHNNDAAIYSQKS